MKPQNFRINAADEKNIKALMKIHGITTKIGAIRFALNLAVTTTKGAK